MAMKVVKMNKSLSLEMLLTVSVCEVLMYKCQLGGVGPRETEPNRPIWVMNEYNVISSNIN